MKKLMFGLILVCGTCVLLGGGELVRADSSPMADSSDSSLVQLEEGDNSDQSVIPSNPVITMEEFEKGQLNDGSPLPEEFNIETGNSLARSGGYTYSYKRDSTKILKSNAVIGDHPGISKQKNIAYYYVYVNRTATATISFGYGPVSVTYSPAGTTAGGVLVESISKGWTQLRIRGNVRESKYTVTVYDKYSGNRIKSYKETKKTTENIWYDTRRA